MSRTLHQRPFSCFKHQRVQNRRKSELSALTDLQAEGLRMRHINRLQSFMTQIPNPWDDMAVSAWNEFHNKRWSKERFLEKMGRYQEK